MRGMKVRVLMMAAIMAIGTIATNPSVARATLDCSDAENADYCGESSGPTICCTAKNGSECCGFNRCVALDWMCSAY